MKVIPSRPKKKTSKVGCWERGICAGSLGWAPAAETIFCSASGIEVKPRPKPQTTMGRRIHAHLIAFASELDCFRTQKINKVILNVLLYVYIHILYVYYIYFLKHQFHTPYKSTRFFQTSLTFLAFVAPEPSTGWNWGADEADARHLPPGRFCARGPSVLAFLLSSALALLALLRKEEDIFRWGKEKVLEFGVFVGWWAKKDADIDPFCPFFAGKKIPGHPKGRLRWFS